MEGLGRDQMWVGVNTPQGKHSQKYTQSHPMGSNLIVRAFGVWEATRAQHIHYYITHCTCWQAAVVQGE